MCPNCHSLVVCCGVRVALVVSPAGPLHLDIRLEERHGVTLSQYRYLYCTRNTVSPSSKSYFFFFFEWGGVSLILLMSPAAKGMKEFVSRMRGVGHNLTNMI